MSTRGTRKRHCAAVSEGAPASSADDGVERKAPAKSKPKTFEEIKAEAFKEENTATFALGEAIREYFMTRGLRSLRDWHAKYRGDLPKLVLGHEVFYSTTAAQCLTLDMRLPFLLEVYCKRQRQYISREEIERYDLKPLPTIEELWNAVETKRMAIEARMSLADGRASMAAAKALARDDHPCL